MEIQLLRHAQTESWSDTGRDFDRPLTAHGRSQAQEAGRWLREQTCMPDMVIASSALRTTQTSQHVCMTMGFSEQDIIFEKDLYNATPGEMIRVLEKHVGPGRILMIGHNPGIEMLAGMFSAERLSHFSPATLVRISIDSEPGHWVNGSGSLIKRPVTF